jgi:hypothetical protein
MYNKYYREKLIIETSIYNPYFLIYTTESKFGLVGLQTDNNLIIINAAFLVLEEKKLKNMESITKPKKINYREPS